MANGKFEYLDGLRNQVSEVRKGAKPELDVVKVGLDSAFSNVESRGISVHNMDVLVEHAKNKLPVDWYLKWKDTDDNSMWKIACDSAMSEGRKFVEGFKGDKSELAYILSWIIAGETVIDKQTAINVQNPLLKNDIGKLSRSIAVIRDGGEDWLEPTEKQDSYNKAIEEVKTTFNVDDTEIKKTMDLLRKNLPEEWFGEWIGRNDEMWEVTFENILPLLNENAGVHIYNKYLKLDFLDRLSWVMRADEILEVEQSTTDKIIKIFCLTDADMTIANYALVSNISDDHIKRLNDNSVQEILDEMYEKVIPRMLTENLRGMGEGGQKRLVRHMFEDFLNKMSANLANDNIDGK